MLRILKKKIWNLEKGVISNKIFAVQIFKRTGANSMIIKEIRIEIVIKMFHCDETAVYQLQIANCTTFAINLKQMPNSLLQTI